MNEEKQIAELAKIICNACEMGNGFDGKCADGNDYKKCGISTETARKIYDVGYRRASEVAREIFAEIDRNIYVIESIYSEIQCVPRGFIDELKKKYIGEGNDGT